MLLMLLGSTRAEHKVSSCCIECAGEHFNDESAACCHFKKEAEIGSIEHDSRSMSKATSGVVVPLVRVRVAGHVPSFTSAK